MLTMSFLSPLYLVGAALIALPIVLHLLRRDVAPPLPFTAVRLLRVSPIERSRRRRLRDILLLLARVAALLLLAGSFARPYLAGARSSTRTTVIAIDRSLSMSAPGVMEKARVLAHEAVDEAGADRVAVIAFDQRADVVASPGPAGDARLAIDEIAPSFGATRYASAFDKTADLLPDNAACRLVIVGDLQRSGFDDSPAALPQGFELVVRDAGGAASNLAVTDIRPEARRLIATIRNFGSAPRETDVRLEVAGRTEVSRRVTIPPSASLDVPFDGMASRAAVDVAASDAEGFAGDNVRYALTEPRGTPRVLIVGGGPGSTAGFYLARALEAEDESGSGFAVRTVHGPEFAAMTPADVAPYSVIAILSTHGLDRRVRDALHAFFGAGGGLLIAAAPDVDPSVLSTVLDWQPALAARDRADAGVLAVSDLRHPIFRPFDAVAANLGQVSFQRAWQVQPGAAWRVVANYTRGMPALVERDAGQGRIVLFTSDLDRRWNDFPLHPAFVPFAQQTVRYLGARAPETATYLVADVPAGVAARPGIMQTEGRTIAVNVDVRESAIDRVTPAEFARLVAQPSASPRSQPARAAAQTEARQGYWRYGLMLMLAALVAECFVGSR
jgi:aerotolerance regulator-like protein/VWA domain-containing protein